MIVRQAGLTNSQSLTYDAENRLVRFAQAGTNLLLVKFGYAADGTRLWKWNNQSAANLQVWIGNIYEEKGGKVLYHVYAGGQLVCSFETNSTLFGGSDTNRVAYYYHEDNLNSSTALSSGGTSGTQIEVDAYYPFGRVMTASPQASFKVSRQFTGQVKDDDTGLCYYNTRYYDPLLGRFIQADTTIPDLGNPQSYNRYSYCLNNPLKYTDPSGYDPAFTPGMSMFEGLSFKQRYAASRAALPATVGITVAAVSGGLATPVLVSAGASAGFTAVGTGLIAGAAGDLAAQGTQMGLGQRQSISGQQVAVSSLVGGALGGTAGKIASELSEANAGTVTPATSGTVAPTFKSGDIIIKEFSTSKGPLEMAAETIIDAKTLHLKDIAVYPKGAGNFELGAKEVLAVKNQLISEAKAMGFDKLRISGTRYSGAKPGKVVDVTFDLTK
jgi:RHS repeat-associated protein